MADIEVKKEEFCVWVKSLKSYLVFLSGCTGSRSVYCDLSLRLSRRIQSRIQLCRVHKLRHSALDRLRQAGSISKCEDVLIVNFRLAPIPDHPTLYLLGPLIPQPLFLSAVTSVKLSAHSRANG